MASASSARTRSSVAKPSPSSCVWRSRSAESAFAWTIARPIVGRRVSVICVLQPAATSLARARRGARGVPASPRPPLSRVRRRPSASGARQGIGVPRRHARDAAHLSGSLEAFEGLTQGFQGCRSRASPSPGLGSLSVPANVCRPASPTRGCPDRDQLVSEGRRKLAVREYLGLVGQRSHQLGEIVTQSPRQLFLDFLQFDDLPAPRDLSAVVCGRWVVVHMGHRFADDGGCESERIRESSTRRSTRRWPSFSRRRSRLWRRNVVAAPARAH